MFKSTYNKRFLCKAILFLFVSILIIPKSYGQKKLLEAIEKRDTAAFDKILVLGVNVNKRKTKIQTRYSISRKRKLKNGKIIIDKSRRRGIPLVYIKRTDLPLTEAAFNENYYFVQELLRRGAKPDKKKNIVLPPLGWAAHRGNIEIVKLLLEHNADINGSEKKWRTSPLIEAIEWKHWEVAKFLIDKGADINKRNKEGKTALSWAVINKNVELTKILVDKGANVNNVDRWGYCVLEDACSDDHLFAIKETNDDIIRYLVEHGAKTNNRAINIVLRKGEAQIAKYLLSKGAPVSNQLGLSAANGKNFELFKYLVDTSHLDIHYYDTTVYWGGSVLHEVCEGYWGDSSVRKINIPMLKYILDKGVNVNDTNMRGQTPLLLLLEYGKRDDTARAAAELLINKGARVNVSGGSMKFSPLMHAAYDKLFETAKLLIQNGANVNAKDYEGKTILHWAAWKYENGEVLKLLVESGADINAKEPKWGETPAVGCAVFNRWENIKTLIDHGADPNIKTNNGLTLLDAVSDEELRKYLISKGAKSGSGIK
jgi:ankyrin repeat protein